MNNKDKQELAIELAAVRLDNRSSGSEEFQYAMEQLRDDDYYDVVDIADTL